MRNKPLLLLCLLPVVLVGATGCSSDTGTPTAEQKKAFLGGPPPANYMSNMQAGANGAAQKAMGATAAKHGG